MTSKRLIQKFETNQKPSQVSLCRVLLPTFVCSVLAFAPGLRAQTVVADPCATSPQSCPTLISTTGTAQTRIPNTAVDVSLGLTVTKADLPEAQRALAAQSGTLLAYLRSRTVQRLVTTNVSFAPQTRFQKNAADKTVGYTGTTNVTFRTTPEKAPEILSGALSNGANTIDSTIFTPTEQQIEDARRDLAAQATKTAMSQIESVAQAVSSHVVSIRTIQVNSEATVAPRPLMFMQAMRSAEAAAPAPSIETAQGDQQISVNVSVTAAVGK